MARKAKAPVVEAEVKDAPAPVQKQEPEANEIMRDLITIIREAVPGRAYTAVARAERYLGENK